MASTKVEASHRGGGEPASEDDRLGRRDQFKHTTKPNFDNPARLRTAANQGRSSDVLVVRVTANGAPGHFDVADLSDNPFLFSCRNPIRATARARLSRQCPASNGASSCCRCWVDEQHRCKSPIDRNAWIITDPNSNAAFVVAQSRAVRIDGVKTKLGKAARLSDWTTAEAFQEGEVWESRFAPVPRWLRMVAGKDVVERRDDDGKIVEEAFPKTCSTCQKCGEAFEAKRSDAKFCSARCKQSVYRRRNAGARNSRNVEVAS